MVRPVRGEALQAVARALGDAVARDEPLGPRTTYRVGGRAALWMEVRNRDDLTAIHLALNSVDAEVPVLVVGKGSNLLVADAGFPGLVVSLGPQYSWVKIEQTSLRAGGATGYPVLARQTAAAGLHGMEWAVGVPGSVGGALRMNAGGHGADTVSVLTGYCLFDLGSGSPLTCVTADLDAGYRHSSVGPGQIVEWASFNLAEGDEQESRRRLSDIVAWRRQHQPGGSNAGSVFTNPPGAPAGQLVEQAGAKGLRIGSAAVSTKHANFIQADEGGSADDVRRVIDAVRELVLDRTGVELVAELVMVGFADSALPMVHAVHGKPSTSTGGTR